MRLSPRSIITYGEILIFIINFCIETKVLPMKLSTRFFLLVITIFISSTNTIAMKCNLFEQGIQKRAEKLLNIFNPVIQTFTTCSEILKKNPDLENFQTTFEVINSTYKKLYKKINDHKTIRLKFMELKNDDVIKGKIEAIKNLFDGFYEALLVNTPSCRLLDHTSEKKKKLQQVISRFLSRKRHFDALAEGKIEALESFLQFDEIEIALNHDISNDENFAQELQLTLNLKFMHDQETRKINVRQRDEQTRKNEPFIKSAEYVYEEEAIPECQVTKQSGRTTFSRAKNDAQFIRDLKATINLIDITKNFDPELFRRLNATQPTILSQLMNREIGKARAYDIMQRNLSQHQMTSYAHYFSECLSPPDESQVTRLKGHNGWIDCIEQLRDGRLASCSHDKTIKIWDLNMGRCVTTLDGHTGWIRDIKQLRDGHLVSCSDDKTIKIWNLNMGKCVTTLGWHKQGITCIEQLNNDHIISGSDDAAIKIWDLNTGMCVATLEGHTLGVRCIKKLNDDYLISGSRDCTIKLWNLASNECVTTLNAHDKWVNSITLLRDGQIASGSIDRTINIWNLETNKCTFTLKAYNHLVYSTILLQDGQLAYDSADGTICIWNLETKKCTTILNIGRNSVNSIEQLNDGRIAFGTEDGTIQIWNFYPKISLEEIALIVHLERCSQENGRVMSLGNGWREVFEGLPTYFQKRFQSQFI